MIVAKRMSHKFFFSSSNPYNQIKRLLLIIVNFVLKSKQLTHSIRFKPSPHYFFRLHCIHTYQIVGCCAWDCGILCQEISSDFNMGVLNKYPIFSEMRTSQRRSKRNLQPIAKITKTTLIISKCQCKTVDYCLSILLRIAIMSSNW